MKIEFAILGYEVPKEVWYHHWDSLREKEIEILRLRAVLELIAAPMRPDGTWNRDRAACQDLAQKALTNQ